MNFLSTGNAWIEIKLDQNPMTLIIGKNGAGKSTIIDALCYGLFGRPYRDINLPGLINSINDAGTCVEVEFRVGSTHYKVIRGMKPSIFQIYQNDVLLNQEAANRDYQKHLEKQILGFNMKSFTQIVVVGSTSFTPFMRLVPQDRRAIIEDLLDIEIFSTMNKVIKTKIKSLDELLYKIKAQISTILEKIELQKRHINDSKKITIEQITKKQADLEEWQTRINTLTNDAKLVQKHVDSLQAQIADNPSVLERITKLEKYNIQITNNLEKLNREITFFNENETCPRCHQDIDNKEQVIGECNIKIQEFSAGLSDLELHQQKLETRLEKIKQIQLKITAHQSELTKLQSQISEIQRYVGLLLVEINDLSNKKPISDDLLEVSKQLYSDLEQQNNQRKEAIDNKTYLDTAALLLKDNGIKAKIIKQYLPVINKMINKYLSAMDFFVNFNIDEEFNETIRSRHRDKFSYENFSEGQKRRIDLSLLFTWRAVAKVKNSVNTNLLILDEILDGSLDADGMDEFMRLLNTFGNETNTFLISHRGEILADKFNNIIRFELVGNFSEILV